MGRVMAAETTESKKPGFLFIGVGNDYRHDDAVGLLVARRLKEQAGDIIEVLEESGQAIRLIEAWRDAELVVVCDAVSAEAGPGTVYHFDVTELPIPGSFFSCSTHAFTLADAIEMGRVLGQLPPKIIVYGIEGANFTPGEGLSPEVEDAAEQVIQSVLALADEHADLALA